MGKRYFVSAANLLPFKGAPSTPQIGLDEDNNLGELSDEDDPAIPERAISGDIPVADTRGGKLNKGKSVLRHSRRRRRS